MNLELRAASPADAALMHRISLEAWRGTVDPNSSLFDETEAYVADVIARGGGFILWTCGEAVGSVRYFPAARDARAWEVKRLGVRPAWRGRGLGKALMDAVETAARRAGVHALQIGIRADQPRLIDYYAVMGFVRDDAVELSAANPRTAPPVTMSRRLGPT